MSIETYGTGERLKIAARLCASIAGGTHLVLLPVPTSRDNRHITGTDINISDTLCNVGCGSVVVGYGLSPEYVRFASELGASVLDLALDEEYLSENAYITALGAVGYILTTSRSTPCETKFGVIGYGRIGSRLTGLLLFLGANVRIYTSKILTRLELGECGVDSVSVSEYGTEISDFDGIDVLINTAPRDMSYLFAEKLPDTMRVLELASGNNFDGVLGVEHLPSLPERMYPESAGGTYFSAVKRFVKKGEIK